MIEVSESTISVESGLENDYRGATSVKRQITLLAKEDWESACKSFDKTIDWKVRRVNLYIEGIELKQSAAKKLKLGKEVILEITGETKPCFRMDEQVNGLTLALMKDWKGGVCCTVIRGGKIQVGDDVQILSK